MPRTSLETTDAFLVTDVAMPCAAGVVRSAPKILVDGATWLARSLTYRFATFGLEASGASAGVNARPDDRPEALAAFSAELADRVAAGSILLEPGKGVRDDDLAPLRAVDPRGSSWWSARHDLGAAGVVAAAETVAPLDGCRVVIEGLDVAGPGLGAALLARLGAVGASVVAVTAAGSGVAAPEGLDLSALASAVEAGQFRDAGPAVEVESALAAPADVLLAGGRAGVVTFEVASTLAVRAVVPWGALPVKAKALALLLREGTIVLPDFVTTAGPSLVRAGQWGDPQWPVPDDAGAPDHVAGLIRQSLLEVAQDPDGHLLGAARRAEGLLAAKLDELPFGRPIA